MTQNNAPRYRHIQNMLQERIRQGIYSPGNRLPSEAALSEEFGVSLITVKRALELLAADGLVRKAQGKGTFVAEESTTPDRPGGASRIIGLVMDDFLAGFGVGITDSMEIEAEKRGYRVVPLRTGGEQARESAAIETLLAAGAQALVITPVHGEYYNQEILRLVLENFPVVFLDRKLDGIPAPFIASDNRTAAMDAFEHLYALGHRRILMVTPSKAAFSLTERQEGIHAFCQTHPDVICSPHYVNFTRQGGSERADVCAAIESISRAIAESDCTAVFCMQHKLALITQHAAAKLGTRIPEDLSVICFDENYDIDDSHFFTHIRQPEHFLGAAAVEAALQKLEAPDTPPAVQLFRATLARGESTAPPREVK